MSFDSSCSWGRRPFPPRASAESHQDPRVVSSSSSLPPETSSMTHRPSITVGFVALIAATVMVRPANAQKPSDDSTKAKPATAPVTGTPSSAPPAPAAPSASGLQPQLPNRRAADQSGVVVFEAPKSDTVPFNGIALAWGAAFTQGLSGAGAQQHRHSSDGQRRQYQSVDRHRPGVHHRDGQPRSLGPVGQGHPRRSHHVPLHPAPSGHMGQGRLSPDRRLAVRRPGVQHHHEGPSPCVLVSSR